MERIKRLIQGALKPEGDQTQHELAANIGISQGAIYKIIHLETDLTLKTIEKIADYFKIPVPELLGYEPNKTNEIKKHRDSRRPENCLFYHSPEAEEACAKLRDFASVADQDQMYFITQTIMRMVDVAREGRKERRRHLKLLGM